MLLKYNIHTINHRVLASAAHILKIGMIQRRLAWPLRKDDTQIREAFHIFNKKKIDEPILEHYN